jgi:hypothetical protein
MKGLSIFQPFASAVASGLKHYEVRSSEPPQGLIGEVIAIHAHSRWTESDRACLTALRSMGCHPCFDDDPPLDCIVAVAKLKACLPAERALQHLAKHHGEPAWEFEEHLTDFSAGGFAWALTGVVALDEPIPCKGPHHLLLELPEDVQKKLDPILLMSALRSVFCG